MQAKILRKIRNAISVFDLLDQEKPPKVVFTTQRDNRVDDRICLQLAGIAFEIDDPLRPIIPDDTHPNCRCYYVDSITGQIVSDISSKRDIKRRSQLTDRQRKNYLKKHKKNKTLKKEDMIVKTMFENEKWQKKSPNFIPTDDTGIRPLSHKTKLPQYWKPFEEQKERVASLEKMQKWLKSI